MNNILNKHYMGPAENFWNLAQQSAGKLGFLS